MRGLADDRGLARSVGQAGVFEEPKRELEREDAGHRGVDVRLVEQALGHGGLRALEEGGGGHDHVVAGVDRRGARLGVVGEEALLADQVAHVVPVGDEGAGVAPFVAQRRR